MKSLVVLFIFISSFLLCSQAEEKKDTEANSNPVKDISVTLSTEAGDIKVTIFASKTPVTAANFLNLALRGFYDATTFHRVIPGFVSQAGKFNSFAAGPGYMIKNETYTEHPELKDLKHDKAGMLSMARQPMKHTNGSQFYITHTRTPHLDGGYTVFGEVTEGLEIAKNLKQGTKMTGVTIHNSTEALFETQKENIAKWNKVLDRNFTTLKKMEN